MEWRNRCLPSSLVSLIPAYVKFIARLLRITLFSTVAFFVSVSATVVNLCNKEQLNVASLQQMWIYGNNSSLPAI
jgi:hypothetical protein